MTEDPRVIVALDFSDADAVLQFVDRIRPEEARLKVGKELFTSAGPQLVRELVGRGFDLFLDLKYHDIPNTVAKACAAAAELGVWMINVHASGGRAMMGAAREAIEGAPQRPLLIGVTVLTSMGAEDLQELGLEVSPEAQVQRLAQLAQSAGLDGVVCSARETASLRQQLGADFKLVTPGIRPQGADQGDQKRVVTPEEAISQGSDYLVIGRPITQAADPMQVLKSINAALAQRLSA